MCRLGSYRYKFLIGYCIIPHHCINYVIIDSKEEEEVEYTKVMQVRKQKQLVEESKRVSVEDLTYAGEMTFYNVLHFYIHIKS